MERIFKIRTKSNRNPMEQYPSERRYSASTVLGLSVMFFQLFLFSLLMGTLIIHRLGINNLVLSNATMDTDETMEELYRHIEQLETRGAYNINIPVLTCAACYIMSIGYLLSFITGIFAWQRWYIDQNITFFCISSSFSTITASVCLVVALLALTCIDPAVYSSHKYSPLSISLLLNLTILSLVGTIWSILSSRLSLKGVRNSYPDDVAKGRKQVDVTTIRKGSKGGNVFPPDIISHFPANDKLAKYLPKKEDNSLPKAESNYEYQQRVDKFLSGEPENSEK